MGCALCNITRCKEFDGEGHGEKVPNPFFCKTIKEEDRFLHELAYDIAAKHPKIMRRINRYFKKLKRKGKNK